MEAHRATEAFIPSYYRLHTGHGKGLMTASDGYRLGRACRRIGLTAVPTDWAQPVTLGQHRDPLGVLLKDGADLTRGGFRQRPDAPRLNSATPEAVPGP